MHIPLNTAKGHLKRGLIALRVRLGEPGTDLRAWHLGVLIPPQWLHPRTTPITVGTQYKVQAASPGLLVVWSDRRRPGHG